MADYLNNFSLEGKVALITGASYGIGFAIAKAMAGAGATIVFNDIKQELVDKGLAAYEAEGIKAHGYVCDVTDEEAVNALVAQIEKEVGVIDILVNNAVPKPGDHVRLIHHTACGNDLRTGGNCHWNCDSPLHQPHEACVQKYFYGNL